MIPLNYGRRTGVTSFIRILKALCILLSEFSPFILDWIATTDLPFDQKETLRQWIQNINGICAMLPTLKANDD